MTRTQREGQPTFGRRTLQVSLQCFIVFHFPLDGSQHPNGKPSRPDLGGESELR